MQIIKKNKTVTDLRWKRVRYHLNVTPQMASAPKIQLLTLPINDLLITSLDALPTTYRRSRLQGPYCWVHVFKLHCVFTEKYSSRHFDDCQATLIVPLTQSNKFFTGEKLNTTHDSKHQGQVCSYWSGFRQMTKLYRPVSLFTTGNNNPVHITNNNTSASLGHLKRDP